MKGFIKKIKEFKWGYIFLAVLTAAISVCLFVFNNDSLDTLAITIGATVTVSAVILAALTLADKERGFRFGIKIALSVAMLICGISSMIARASVIDIIIGIFGLIIIIDGAFKFNTTALSKRTRAAFWYVLLALSATLIAGGYVTVRYLHHDNAISVYILGLLFLVDSIANFLSAFFLAHIDKVTEKEIIEKHEQALLEEPEKIEDTTDSEQKSEEPAEQK